MLWTRDCVRNFVNKVVPFPSTSTLQMVVGGVLQGKGHINILCENVAAQMWYPRKDLSSVPTLLYLKYP